MPRVRPSARPVLVSGYEDAALLIACEVRGSCPTMELAHLTAHILRCAQMPRSDKTIQKHLGDLVASRVFSKRESGKFRLLRRSTRIHLSDPAHFRNQLKERLPGQGRRRPTADDIREWTEARGSLRRAEECLPEVRPSGAMIRSKVKPLERLRSREPIEAERILSSPIVTRFLYRDGPPGDLCSRLRMSVDTFHSQLAGLESNPGFTSAWAPLRDMPTPEPVAIILAVLAAAGRKPEAHAVVVNLGLDERKVADFLEVAVPLARKAANGYKHARAAEGKLREHLRYHAGLQRPLTLYSLPVA